MQDAPWDKMNLALPKFEKRPPFGDLTDPAHLNKVTMSPNKALQPTTHWPNESTIPVPQTQSALICSYNELLSVVAVHIESKDRSPARMHGRDASPNSDRLCQDYLR
jgi:hypothetical protein